MCCHPDTLIASESCVMDSTSDTLLLNYVHNITLSLLFQAMCDGPLITRLIFWTQGLICTMFDDVVTHACCFVLLGA